MKTTAKKIVRRVADTAAADTYFALIRESPLRAIKTRADYQQAARMIGRLAVRDDLDAGERQYLDAIEVLVGAYDDKAALGKPDTRPPFERLKAVMASSGTTRTQLRKVLGTSQSLVSMILNGRRGLSKKAITKLAAHFKLEAGYFM